MVEKEFKCFICGRTFFSLHGDYLIILLEVITDLDRPMPGGG